jgi:hypothetical protein
MLHRAGRVNQVVESLPSKSEALSSNPSTAKENTTQNPMCSGENVKM